MFPAETENNKSNSNKQEQAIWSLKKLILGGKTAYWQNISQG